MDYPSSQVANATERYMVLRESFGAFGITLDEPRDGERVRVHPGMSFSRNIFVASRSAGTAAEVDGKPFLIDGGLARGNENMREFTVERGARLAVSDMGRMFVWVLNLLVASPFSPPKVDRKDYVDSTLEDLTLAQAAYQARRSWIGLVRDFDSLNASAVSSLGFKTYPNDTKPVWPIGLTFTSALFLAFGGRVIQSLDMWKQYEWVRPPMLQDQLDQGAEAE